MRKSLPIIVAMVALLGLQFADCMSAATRDPQSMQCCGSMPCDPSNQSHDCCKSMASPEAPSVLPVSHVTLHFPVLDTADFLATPQVPTYIQVSRFEFAAPQHSPPELYTIYASLLI